MIMSLFRHSSAYRQTMRKLMQAGISSVISQAVTTFNNQNKTTMENTKEKFTIVEQAIHFLIPAVGLMLYATNYKDKLATDAMQTSVSGLIIYLAAFCMYALDIV